MPVDRVTAEWTEEIQADGHPLPQRYSTYGALTESQEELLSRIAENKEQATCCKQLYPDGFLSHLHALFVIGWPITIIQITQYLFGGTALVFTGRMGKLELDAVALANSMMNITGISIALGLSSACDTLFSQLFGSDNKQLIGVVLQKSLVIMFLSCLPCWAIQLNTESLLILVQQDREVARMTGQYMLICMPGIMCYFIYCALVKFLQSQNIVYPSMIIGLVSAGLNALLHYIFLDALDWGVMGSALSQSVSYTVMCLLNVAYILITGVHKPTWRGWSTALFQDWGAFWLALLSMLMICIEWWAFEVGILLSGILGTTSLAAQSIALQFDNFWYSFPLGVSVACSIIVGQFLGAGEAKKAQTAARVSLTAAAMLGAFFGSLFVIFRDDLPRLFNDDEEVLQLTSQVLPIMGINAIFDGISCVAGGALRGGGKMYIGAIIFCVGYLVALSTGLPLMMLTPVGILGFWSCIAVCIVVVCCVMVALVYRFNWNRLVGEALARTHPDVIREEDEGGNQENEDEPLLRRKSRARSRASVWRARTMSFVGGPGRRRATTISGHHSITRRISVYRPIYLDEPTFIDEPPPMPGNQLIIRRIVVILLCVASLAFGILIRILNDTSHKEDGVTTMTTASMTSPHSAEMLTLTG